MIVKKGALFFNVSYASTYKSLIYDKTSELAN